MMNVLSFAVVGAASNQAELVYVWKQATPEGKAVIACLVVFSIIAWSVMTSKALQMRRARRLNYYFNEEFRSQKTVLELFDRKLQVEGCPLYEVYQGCCTQLDARLRGPGGERAGSSSVTLKNMEHVKRAIENVVAQESLKLESGLILLAIASGRCAVSGIARHGLGRDEHVCRHRPAGLGDDGGHGARRLRGAHHHGGRPARGHPLDVWLQLAGTQFAGVYRRTRQFCAGTGFQNGNGISGGRMNNWVTCGM
jgi:hypothetical protein